MRDSLIGRFAISKAGHDAGIVYLIVAEEVKLVYLSDGRFHPLDKPKKKNKKHIQFVNKAVSDDLLNRLQRKEKIFDHEIKYVIKTIAGKEEGHV